MYESSGCIGAIDCIFYQQNTARRLGCFNLIIHLYRKDCNYLKIKKNASVTLYKYDSVGEQ